MGRRALKHSKEKIREFFKELIEEL